MSPEENGFATPAAMAFAVSLALTGVAALAAASAQRERATARWETLRTEYALDAAHERLQLRLAQVLASDRFDTIEQTFAGPVAVTAEREAFKAPLSSADETLLGDLGAAYPAATSLALKSVQSSDPRWRDKVRAASPTSLWRECALRRLSAEGRGTGEPRAAGDAASMPLGELWTIRARSANGRMVDDRLVRIVGGPTKPLRVLDRRLERPSTGACK